MPAANRKCTESANSARSKTFASGDLEREMESLTGCGEIFLSRIVAVGILALHIHRGSFNYVRYC